jgi:hypothetical protein
MQQAQFLILDRHVSGVPETSAMSTRIGGQSHGNEPWHAR